MDRRAFLRATGTAAATSAALVAPDRHRLRAIGDASRFNPTSEKPFWIDGESAAVSAQPHPTPIAKDTVQNPRLGGGSQGIAPEFYLSFAGYAVSGR